MKTKKNLTLISLMLGVMMLVSASGLVSAETEVELPAPCAVTVSKPTADWYNGNVPIEWSYSDSCSIEPDQDVNFNNGSDQVLIFHFNNTYTQTALWNPIEEGENLKICIDTELSGTGDEVEGCSAEFGVDKTKPVITTSDETCDEGETITLSASATDALSEVNSGSWAWIGANKISENETESSASYTCLDGPTTETVSVSVLDNAGNVQTEDVVITVNNVAPKANAGGPYNVNEGSSVTLLGTATDVDADLPLTFAWDLDNDEEYDDSYVAETTFSCSQNGTYTVNLKVTDKDGGIGYDSAVINCADVLPVINTGTYTCNEGETITLTASATDVDADLPLTFAWDLNGNAVFGESEETGTIVDYTCGNGDAIVNVPVKVTDSFGISATENAVITINNLPPTANANGPYNAALYTPVCFFGSATDVYDTSFTYEWDFNYDGTFNVDSTSQNPCSAVYSALGEHTIALRVKDDFDYSAIVTSTVTVYEYAIPLNKGWNLISIPLVPEDTSIDFVFSTILDKVAYDEDDIATILQYDAVLKKWYKARPNAEEPTEFYWASDSKLENVVPGYGYYIKMAENAVLYLNGKKSYLVEGQDTTPIFGVPPSVTLAMDSWNLIGVYGQGNPLVNLALKSLEDEEGNKYYDIIIDKFGGQWYYNTWSSLHSTDGYWISIKKAFGGEQTVEYKSNYAPDCYSHYSQLPA